MEIVKVMRFIKIMRLMRVGRDIMIVRVRLTSSIGFWELLGL